MIICMGLNLQSSLAVDDRVLLRNLGWRGKHKLQSRWSSIPHLVIGKMPHLPLYHLKSEQGQGGVRSLHHDNLLPTGQWVRMPESIVDVEPIKGVKTRSQSEKKMAEHIGKRNPNLNCQSLLLRQRVKDPPADLGTALISYCRIVWHGKDFLP